MIWDLSRNNLKDLHKCLFTFVHTHFCPIINTIWGLGLWPTEKSPCYKPVSGTTFPGEITKDTVKGALVTYHQLWYILCSTSQPVLTQCTHSSTHLSVKKSILCFLVSARLAIQHFLILYKEKITVYRKQSLKDNIIQCLFECFTFEWLHLF